MTQTWSILLRSSHQPVTRSAALRARVTTFQGVSVTMARWAIRPGEAAEGARCITQRRKLCYTFRVLAAPREPYWVRVHTHDFRTARQNSLPDKLAAYRRRPLG